ncbi:MAG: lyase family protein, partial [Campylobacter lanienae]|nr:lyase family protein [Campylobacteraceae bacterium]MDY2817678.1 lyase family protein [Campylobacter lanienae]
MKKMWDGRFNEASSELLEEFNASIFFDKELFKEDIAGSKAHAKMLGECGILDADDVAKIRAGLDQVLGEIERGEFTFSVSQEDIHMAVEGRLSQIIGKELGGRLHTARSRNDQVALDFRAYCQNRTKELA